MQSLQESGWFLATEGSTGREWWGLLVVALGILGWLWGKRLGRRRLPLSISSLLLATLITGQLTGCGAEGGAAGGAPKKARPGEITPENTSYRIVMHDPLGNALGEVDSQGNRLASARVEPYGARKVDPALQTSRVHAGTPYDAGVGLDQMGQRSYAPDLGHFVSGDPVAISEPERHITPEFGAAHPYAYANHRPTGAVDRSGEFFVPAIAVAAMGGYALGGALEAARQYAEHGKIVSWGRINASGTAGCIAGTLTVVNPAAGIGAVMAAGGLSNVAGGVAERLLNSGGQSAGTVSDVAVDFGLGAASGGLSKVAGPLIQKLRPPQVKPLNVAGGAPDAVALYHGSIRDGERILANGLDLRRGTAFVSRDKEAALDALLNHPDAVAGAGRLVESRVPAAVFQEHLAPFERPYYGFFPYRLTSTEITLRGVEQIEIFNQYIVK